MARPGSESAMPVPFQSTSRKLVNLRLRWTGSRLNDGRVRRQKDLSYPLPGHGTFDCSRCSAKGKTFPIQAQPLVPEASGRTSRGPHHDEPFINCRSRSPMLHCTVSLQTSQVADLWAGTEVNIIPPVRCQQRHYTVQWPLAQVTGQATSVITLISHRMGWLGVRAATAAPTMPPMGAVMMSAPNVS